MQGYSGRVHTFGAYGRAVVLTEVAPRHLQGSGLDRSDFCRRRTVGGCDGRDHRDPAPGTSKYRKAVPEIGPRSQLMLADRYGPPSATDFEEQFSTFRRNILELEEAAVARRS